jgi:N-acetylglucosaminyl-diphospho-decaprenol L-rhamnosyltransferase
MSFTGSVIIVNFNSGGCLARCLDSIAELEKDSDVLVVDNASTDGSEQTAERGGRVALQRNAENVGFARAVNQGLARTGGEFVLLLNPDCELRPGSLDRLVSELRLHPHSAIAGPKILDEDGAVQGSARGDPTLLTGLFGRSTLLTRLFSGSELARRNVRFDLATAGRANEAGYDVDWVSGACMMARREMLKTVGGFDERYFLYWEDADLCRRLRGRGWGIRYVTSAEVVHRAGQSSRTVHALSTRAFHDSAYLYYATHVARTPFTRGLARVVLGARCRLKQARPRRTA